MSLLEASVYGLALLVGAAVVLLGLRFGLPLLRSWVDVTRSRWTDEIEERAIRKAKAAAERDAAQAEARQRVETADATIAAIKMALSETQPERVAALRALFQAQIAQAAMNATALARAEADVLRYASIVDAYRRYLKSVDRYNDHCDEGEEEEPMGFSEFVGRVLDISPDDLKPVQS